uniref:Uncharacterized protein n=1 Tax=Avena sativa TaxID=4498 RepID=A0ACD5ZLL0_AVESA
MLCAETAETKGLPLSLLEEITDGFSDEQRIGSGGFAVVYKGKLENRIVAVKRMSNTYMYEKEFHREVECLMMVKHKNVVRFLGYCADTQGSMERYGGKFVMADVQQRLLCFEYLPKGSLHAHITDASRGLRWRDRYEIVTGICQGLHYLHLKNIVHLDLKPANILLDDNFVPKITDFGISRCFDEMQSQVMTKISGTPGYLAPESYNYTEVTYRKSYRLDIYSLGVVIIEILTGKKGYHDVDDVVDSWTDMLEESQKEVQLEQVRVCAEIGIDCTNFDPAKRPDTQYIISRLNETVCMDGYIENSVITSLQIDPDMLIGTTHDLCLSYQQLNPDIRRCIEYCSIFPRGSKLRMVQLVRLWIAQGFVHASSATTDMEDVAQCYIQELVSCSFLQPIESTSDTDCFTIHYDLYDLLEKVTRNDYCIIENKECDKGEGWEGAIPRYVQHLFIEKYDAKLINEKTLGLKSLRTLIIYFVEEDTPIEEKVLEGIFEELPELRVVAFAWSQEHAAIMLENKFSIPESICRLKHLRPEVQAEVLEGLCPPVGLQTLHIEGYQGSRYPDWMVGKQNGGLQELQFWVCLGPVPQLVEAYPHLRLLQLCNCSWDALPGNMENLKSLKKLYIFGCPNIRSLPTLPRSLESFVVILLDDEFTKSYRLDDDGSPLLRPPEDGDGSPLLRPLENSHHTPRSPKRRATSSTFNKGSDEDDAAARTCPRVSPIRGGEWDRRAPDALQEGMAKTADVTPLVSEADKDFSRTPTTHYPERSEVCHPSTQPTNTHHHGLDATIVVSLGTPLRGLENRRESTRDQVRQPHGRAGGNNVHRRSGSRPDTIAEEHQAA